MRWRPHTEAVDDRRMQGRSQPAAPSSEPPTGLNDPRDFHTRATANTLQVVGIPDRSGFVFHHG